MIVGQMTVSNTDGKRLAPNAHPPKTKNQILHPSKNNSEFPEAPLEVPDRHMPAACTHSHLDFIEQKTNSFLFNLFLFLYQKRE